MAIDKHELQGYREFLGSCARELRCQPKLCDQPVQYFRLFDFQILDIRRFYFAAFWTIRDDAADSLMRSL